MIFRLVWLVLRLIGFGRLMDRFGQAQLRPIHRYALARQPEVIFVVANGEDATLKARVLDVLEGSALFPPAFELHPAAGGLVAKVTGAPTPDDAGVTPFETFGRVLSSDPSVTEVWMASSGREGVLDGYVYKNGVIERRVGKGDPSLPAPLLKALAGELANAS